MCGIVGYTGNTEAAPIILSGLSRLEYRGYDSAGIATCRDGNITVRKIKGRMSRLCEICENGLLTKGHTGIGHTRWATHGVPSDENAHPHTSSDGRFAVVHNGIIENYMPLREELSALGYIFASDTDTEVIVHLFEHYYEGDARQAIIKTVARLRGSYALAVLCAEENDKIFLAKESSPLIIGVGAGESYFASDITALIEHTRSVIYLEDGEFAEISPTSVTVFNSANRTVDKSCEHVSWNIQAAERGGYEHFMLKEIYEQPRAVLSTISSAVTDEGLPALGLSEEYIKNVKKILIVACGSAYYAGMAGRYAIEQLCKIPVSVELASEVRYSEPLIDESTLAIVISQSGETADTIAAMKECKRRGTRCFAIVNVVGSTVAKLADSVLYTAAGPEIAVATTKGYTTQLTALYIFAVLAARALGRIDEEGYAELLSALRGLPKNIQAAIDMNPHIAELATKYKEASSIFYIGRSTDSATALEGALKMKEISYIHAEAYAAGELKHGTIALISENQPVVALCCNDSVAEKTMNNIIEVKARGARVLALTHTENDKITSVADDLILVPKVEPIFSGVAEIIPLQLLAYYTAKVRGCDIDKPKNLAKSVTVE